MPNCFSLTFKGDTEPSTLEFVDRFICQRLELPYHPRIYTCGWYDDIGFKLACGVSLTTQIDILRNSSEEPTIYQIHERIMWRVAALLNEHFIANAWAEIGRR